MQAVVASCVSEVGDELDNAVLVVFGARDGFDDGEPVPCYLRVDVGGSGARARMLRAEKMVFVA